MVVRLYGCEVVWLYGYTVVRLYGGGVMWWWGYMVVRLWDYVGIGFLIL